MRTIRKGDSGDAVMQWQGILGIGESGAFDQTTEEWTAAWQRQRGLEPDGIVGPKTWAAAGMIDRLVTSDIDDDFFPKLRLVAMAVGARARDMMSVMFSESACRADAWNDNPKSLPPEQRWNASGLIQFMPETLRGLGWSQGHEAFRKLTPTEQLSWVERYYRPYRGHLGSIGALYTATFLPALVRHAGDPSFVLTAKAGVLPWAYGPNAVFDTNQDLAITVGELEAAVARNCHGPRWESLLTRLLELDAVPTLPALDNPASQPTLAPRPLSEAETGSGPIVHPLAYPLDEEPEDG